MSKKEIGVTETDKSTGNQEFVIINFFHSILKSFELVALFKFVCLQAFSLFTNAFEQVFSTENFLETSRWCVFLVLGLLKILELRI